MNAKRLSTSPIRIGLLGAGRFGRSLAAVVSDLPEMQLTAVYDASPDATRQLADEFDAQACKSSAELLALPSVDAVLIATSHDTHAELAIAAARAGKHILCEKPMALDVAECQSMIDAAHHYGVQLLVGQVTRLIPLFQRMHRLVQEGAIGRPVAMHIVRSGWFERHGWWAQTSTSGGMLHSHGAHMYDLVNSFLGRPLSVTAVAGPRIQPQVDYDDTIFSLINYESGAVASVGASISGQTWVYQGSLIGDAGSIQFSLGLPECWLEVQRRGAPEPIRESFGTFDQESTEGVLCELENFADMLLLNAPPFVAPDAALEAVAMIQAAYESVRTGGAVPILSYRVPVENR